MIEVIWRLSSVCGQETIGTKDFMMSNFLLWLSRLSLSTNVHLRGSEDSCSCSTVFVDDGWKTWVMHHLDIEKWMEAWMGQRELELF